MFRHLFRNPYSLTQSLVTAALVLGTAGCGSSPQAYVERGNRFFNDAKYEDATLQYEKAIQKDPNLGEAHYRLGLLDLKKNNPVQAYRELQRAVELMPNNSDAAARSGELSLGLYNSDTQHPQFLFDQATNAAGKLLKKDPAGFDGNLLSGAIALIEKKPEPAVSYLRKAVQAKPSDLNAQLGLARALVLNNQIPEGVALGRQLITTDKTFAGSYDFLFQQFRATNRQDEAEAVLKLKVANNPKQAGPILELARFYAAENRNPEMAGALQRILNNPAAFPDAHLIAGDFYYTAKRRDDAYQQYEAGLNASEKEKDKVPYRKRIIRILANEQKWSEASQQLEAVLKVQPGDDEAKLVRALVWLDEGKPENLDPAVAELRAQLPKHPQDALLHFQAGNALMRKNDRDAARVEWLTAARLNPNYLPPRYSLAQLDLEQGKADDAVQVADEILNASPRDPRALLLHAAALTAAGQFQRAHAELNRLASEYPTVPDVKFRLGVLAISERKFKDAEQIFQKLEGTKAPQVLAGLAQAYEGQNQSGKALQLLQEEVRKSPTSSVLRQMLARLAMMDGKYDVAVEQYKVLADPTPPASPMNIALATAYAAKGDSGSAIEILKKVVQADPKNTAASIQLAQVYVATGNLAEAKTLYRSALKVQPHDANALNDLAYIMAETDENLDQALAMAQQGMEFAAAPGLKSSLSDTLGWIYLKKKMYGNALQTFQGLVANNPSDATFRYHLGATLFQTGDKQKARTELEAALAAKPARTDEPKIRELLSRL